MERMISEADGTCWSVRLTRAGRLEFITDSGGGALLESVYPPNEKRWNELTNQELLELLELSKRRAPEL